MYCRAKDELIIKCETYAVLFMYYIHMNIPEGGTNDGNLIEV
ncbi:hypothetical protein PAECIP112173_04430 [Paenibacillus sp. JJ-100]|nr:hypothetical protein PAECIP112173_04430 [Paenibacillus sp. JJ-100]